MSDEDVIQRVLNGSKHDYAELMRRYSNLTFTPAYRILGSREEAEDAMQEAFVSAFGSLSQCRERDKFWPWLRRIALNICLKRMPRQSLCVDIDSLPEELTASEASVEREVFRRVEAEQLRKAVYGLPCSYRVVVVLKYQECLTCGEISEIVGESVDTIYTRLHRARKMLAERLAVMKDEVR